MPEHTPPLSGNGARRTDPDPLRQSTNARASLPVPAEEQVVYRADPTQVEGARRNGFDVLATLGGALAALGAFVLLSALVGAVVGSIGYQSDVDGQDLSVGGLIAGLAVLLLACLIGGWVAGRLAGHRGGLHGLVAIAWLVLLAALLAALATLAGSRMDVRDQIALPDWFSSDALGTAAVITGLVALALMLLGGWLGGRIGERQRHTDHVQLVERRTSVRRRRGGIVAGDPR